MFYCSYNSICFCTATNKRYIFSLGGDFTFDPIIQCHSIPILNFKKAKTKNRCMRWIRSHQLTDRLAPSHKRYRVLSLSYIISIGPAQRRLADVYKIEFFMPHPQRLEFATSHISCCFCVKLSCSVQLVINH